MFKPKIDRISYGGAMIGKDEVNAIMQVIHSHGGRRWTIGDETKAFEDELASVTGVKRAVMVNSGSSALLVALTGLKLGNGAKVIIPACNFPTAMNSIIQSGYTPVVVDSDTSTLNLDLNQVKKAIKKHDDIKAVIAVHIAGNPVDLVKLRGIIGDRKIIVDNCDGYGSTTDKGVFVEKMADVACVSFHAAHIITTGEGGAVLTNNEKLADTCLKLREWGRASGSDKIYSHDGFPSDYRERYVYEEIGYNLKPLELQCAMGRVQLKRLDEFKEARKINHKKLKNVFSKYKTQFLVQKTPDNYDPCWFSFAFKCIGTITRKVLFKAFEDANIECRTIFSGNILAHPAYDGIKHIKIGFLPGAKSIMWFGMFLSCHPSLNDDQIGWIETVLKKTVKKHYEN